MRCLCCVQTADGSGFTYVQACRLGLGSGNSVGDAGNEAEDEDGGLHFEV